MLLLLRLNYIQSGIKYIQSGPSKTKESIKGHTFLEPVFLEAFLESVEHFR